MKLYAKTTSERASKGQGGNKEIVIDLTIDPIKRKTVGRVIMRYDEYTGYTIYFYPITEETGKGGRILLHEEKEEPKGKQEKGEYVCKKCGLTRIEGTREQTRDFIFSDICIDCNKQ